MSSVKKVGIDAINEKLMDVMDRLMSNNDDRASECEKIDVETARAVNDVARTMVEGYKVKANVMSMLQKTDNPLAVSKLIGASGITDASEVNEGNTLNKL